MKTLALDSLQHSLTAFVSYRQQHLSGDEKGEAQVFCDRLFRALGHEGLREAGATLEMRLKKQDSRGTAFADLMWKPRCLIEMKKAGTDLSKHYRQAFDYWVAAVPDRPRYVVLCNFDEFWIYDFDNQLDEPVDRISIDDLPARSEALGFLFPTEERPIFGNDLVAVTRDAAANVAALFLSLSDRSIERHVGQRFALQSVMAMFAEDIGLLPSKSFTKALTDAKNGTDAYDLLFALFREMNTPGVTAGGRFKGTPYFNGGLFAEISPIELTDHELELLRTAASSNWAEVRPEIFGTLFEGSMDEGERHARGAHFTSQADIAMIVGPCIVAPWRARIEQSTTVAQLESLLMDIFSFRVLDPACGSGNFLYVAYREMRRLEHEILERIATRRRSSDIAAQGALTYVAADHFLGMDINPFAVEMAKVTMMLATKLAADELGDTREVLPLDNLSNSIKAQDALFTPWPKADVVIGNPPYLGRRKMVDELGADYTSRLADRHPSVGGVSDFVSYWFPLTHTHLPPNGRAGLVATNTIRQNDSRIASLDHVVDHGGTIFEAVASQPWSGDAAVHVSIVNWIKGPYEGKKILWLNDAQLRLETDFINSSLSPKLDVRTAEDLLVNESPASCFQGQTPGVTVGFIIDASMKDSLIAAGEGAVIHPFLGGKEMLSNLVPNKWIIDIPEGDLIQAKQKYPKTLEHLAKFVLPIRQEAAEKQMKANEKLLVSSPKAKTNKHHINFLNQWWRLSYRREEMLAELHKKPKYIATSRVASEERATVFEFVESVTRPGDSLSVFALNDNYSFGILSSSIHRAWFEIRCSTLETRLRYTPTTVWNTFPWPQAPALTSVERIEAISRLILDLREEYKQQGFSLKKQYDALRSPGQSKLRKLHLDLDKAVFAAYGFEAGSDIPTQLLALNQSIALDQEAAQGPGYPLNVI